MAGPNTGDVIDVLIGQHEQITALFAAIGAAPADKRGRTFRDLVTLIHKHEQAEQRVTHPLVADRLHASKVAQARLAEEHAADLLLVDLAAMGVNNPEFVPRLAEYRRVVTDHAQREEQEEFPLLRQHVSVERLHLLAGELLSLETMH